MTAAFAGQTMGLLQLQFDFLIFNFTRLANTREDSAEREQPSSSPDPRLNPNPNLSIRIRARMHARPGLLRNFN